VSLWSDFLSNNGRPINKWSHYFAIYERHFAAYRERAPLFVEIGCGEGGSLQLWKRYFGSNARIIGIDNRNECRSFEENQIHVRIGDQADHRFLASIIDEWGCPDIVLDDGSHMMEDMKASFDFFFPRMSLNGIYMVEDLHTCYWEEFGGGLRRPGTFIEISKSLVDQLNGFHFRDAGPVDALARFTNSIHFYDSIVVFERMPRQEPQNMQR
jgi:hypothetical protein